MTADIDAEHFLFKGQPLFRLKLTAIRERDFLRPVFGLHHIEEGQLPLNILPHFKGDSI